MRIALFGPPGIGKSTITKELKGLDLESKIYRDAPSGTLNMLEQSSYLVLGAGNFQPEQLENVGFSSVLLTLSEHDYERRRELRDAVFPFKADQLIHRVQQWRSEIRDQEVVSE